MRLFLYALLPLVPFHAAAQPDAGRGGYEMEMPSFSRPDLPPDFEPPRRPARPVASPEIEPLRPPPEVPEKRETKTPGTVPAPVPVEPVSIPPARKAPLSLSRINEEFLFLRRSFATEGSEVLEPLYAQARALLAAAREGERAEHIQFLIIEIRRKQQRPIDAVIEGLKLLFEYPGSTLTFNTKRVVQEISMKHFKRRRDEIAEMTKGPRIGLSRAERLAMMLEKLAAFSDAQFYAATTREFREFFERYPGYANRDSLSYLLAGLHARNGDPRAAVFLYERILALSEKDPLKASAQSAVGDLFARALGDPDRAVGAYQALAEGFPDSPEAQTAYGRWGGLLDEKLKQPMLAVEVLEKAVQIYPGSDAAHDALSASARILARRLQNRTRAVETLERLADMFPGVRAVAGLRRAADLHGEGREYAAQARTLIRLHRRYPDDPYSPEALWAAARLYDKKLDDETAARRIYHDLIESYPQHPRAEKAKRRLESLE